MMKNMNNRILKANSETINTLKVMVNCERKKICGRSQGNLGLREVSHVHDVFTIYLDEGISVNKQ